MIQSLKRSLVISLFLPVLFSGCAETDPPPIPDVPLSGLKDKYKDHFLIGSMIQDQDITHPSGVVERHCSIVTVNHFYWRVVHPEMGVYDFEPGDRRVNYAMQKGLKIRGHPLLFEHF